MAYFFRIAVLGLAASVPPLVAPQDTQAHIVRPPPVITISYQYDALGRLVHVNNPVAGNRDYLYDDAGNRESVATNSEARNLSHEAADDTASLLLEETVTSSFAANDKDPDGSIPLVADFAPPGDVPLKVTPGVPLSSSNPGFMGIYGCTFPTAVDFDGWFSFSSEGIAGVSLVRRAASAPPDGNPTQVLRVDGNLHSENGLAEGLYQQTAAACDEEASQTCSSHTPTRPAMSVWLSRQCNSRNPDQGGR